jgi:hypothetical protein
MTAMSIRSFIGLVLFVTYENLGAKTGQGLIKMGAGSVKKVLRCGIQRTNPAKYGGKAPAWAYPDIAPQNVQAIVDETMVFFAATLQRRKRRAGRGFGRGGALSG